MTTQVTHSVLVTGGSAGIGLGLALRYLRAGHRVLVTGRDAGRLAAVSARVPGSRRSPATSPTPVPGSGSPSTSGT